jgi:uncharacterized membrane protein required for colicin V production
LYILDILLLVLLLRAVIVGYRRGFWQSAAGLFSLGIGLWTAVHYYRPFAQYLDQKFLLSQGLSVWLTGRVIDSYPLAGIGSELFSDYNLPKGIEDLPFSENFQNVISNNISDIINSSGQLILKTVINPISQNLANVILDSLAFLLIVVGLNFVCRLVFLLLGFVFENGVLGAANRGGGALFSLTTQGLVLTIFFGMLLPIWPVFSFIGAGDEPGIISTLGKALESSWLIPKFVNLYAMLSKLVFGI